MAELGGAAAVIPASTLVTHHADTEWPFRQNSDFWYLTGLDEPDAVALFPVSYTHLTLPTKA